MKRGIVGMLIVVLSVSVGAAATAQEGGPGGVLGRIMVEMEDAGDLRFIGELADIDEETMEQVVEIRNNADEAIRVAKSEIEIVQARIQRLLLDDDPDLDRIEDLVREASQWEVDIRMAQIERDVAIRGLVGDNAWARLLQTRRIMGEAQRLRLEAATRERMEMLEKQFLDREHEFFKRRLMELEERLEGADGEAAERIEMLRRELEETLGERAGRRR